MTGMDPDDVYDPFGDGEPTDGFLALLPQIINGPHGDIRIIDPSDPDGGNHG